MPVDTQGEGSSGDDYIRVVFVICVLRGGGQLGVGMRGSGFGREGFCREVKRIHKK